MIGRTVMFALLCPSVPAQLKVAHSELSSWLSAEPPSRELCATQRTCPGCIAAACGWCVATKTCVPDEPEECKPHEVRDPDDDKCKRCSQILKNSIKVGDECKCAAVLIPHASAGKLAY